MAPSSSRVDLMSALRAVRVLRTRALRKLDARSSNDLVRRLAVRGASLAAELKSRCDRRSARGAGAVKKMNVNKAIVSFLHISFAGSSPIPWRFQWNGNCTRSSESDTSTRHEPRRSVSTGSS
jgi:hypothetical protein